MTKWPLKDLLKLFDLEAHYKNTSFYSGFHVDSRKIKPGWIFFSLKGESTDGRQFISNAIKNGAMAVIAEQDKTLPVSFEQNGVVVYAVKDLGQRIGNVLHRLFGSPSSQMNVIGITGTNGKTSCAFFLAQALKASGYRCGISGTIGTGIYPDLVPSGNTTPGIYNVHSFLANCLCHSKVHWAVMEVTSHALCQRRVDGVEFDTALFTNISRDHLDYHSNMRNYVNAKSRLFTQQGLKNAVINLDDDHADSLISKLPATVNLVTYSLHNHKAEIYLQNLQHTEKGVQADIISPWGKGLLSSSLYGRFNLYNLLGVIGVLGCHGFTLTDILPIVSTMGNVPGRMALYGMENQKPTVIVDYAHTPDALKNALSAIREHHKKTITCIFGCGGDRDRGKRPLMMKSAMDHADTIVLTSDNPRFEDPQQIINDTLSAVTESVRHRLTVIEDRASAIRQTIKQAKPSDVILIAGKGHENYQQIGRIKHHFDDSEHVQEALNNHDAQ